MNEIKIIGNLGRDPEIRYTGTGTPVMNFSLAHNELRKEREPVTHWFKVLVWGKRAERLAQSGLMKGQRVIVCGRIVNNQWTDKDGAVRVETQIHANQIYKIAAMQEREESTGFFPEE